MSILIARILAAFGNTSAKTQVAVYAVEHAKSKVDDRRAALLAEETAALATTKTVATSLNALATGIQTAETSADAARAADLTAFDDRTEEQIKALQECLRQLEIRRAAARIQLTSIQAADRAAAREELNEIVRALGTVSRQLEDLIDQQTADEAIAESFSSNAE